MPLLVSIHAPREGYDISSFATIKAHRVSIHAPREGCDIQSLQHMVSLLEVSIHAPREGCDIPLPMLASSSPSFNSRTPGGVRLQLDTLSDDEFTFQFTHPGRGATNTYSLEFDQFVKFQFTHPGRGATALHAQRADGVAVSIHAPREGCDSSTRSGACVSTSFHFTHPGRGATRLPPRLPTHGNVSIHAPREGCDWNRQNAYNTPYVSIHAPREGCDCKDFVSSSCYPCFNSRTPGGVRL